MADETSKKKLHEYVAQYYPQYHTIEHYPADKCAVVHKLEEEWGIFSNFAHTPITVEGVVYDTSERLFQVSKMNCDEARKLVYEKKGNPKMTAKHIAKEHPEWVRKDWYQTFIDVMRWCLELKYQQSEEFREALRRSEGLFIVEDQTNFSKKHADTWGTKREGDEFVGPNLLGRLLMELRESHK